MEQNRIDELAEQAMSEQIDGWDADTILKVTPAEWFRAGVEWGVKLSEREA